MDETMKSTMSDDDDNIVTANHNLEDLGLVHVGIPLLLVTAVPLLLMAFIGNKLDLGLENTIVVSVSRAFVQLMILGLILHPIFVLGMDDAWIVALYVLAMILIATKETLSRPKYNYHYQPVLTFLTILLSITTVGAFTFLLIIRPEPLWNPQYVIPICGMLMGNCITGLSLSVTNLSTQIMEGGRREVELCLCFGGSGWESVGRLMKGAIGVGVTPMLNTMNVIGLVSIPGMMTGQILGGSPVTEAAHYQILIIYLISTCTFSTIFMNVYIVYRVAFDGGSHVLRTDRFIEMVKSKGGKDKENGWVAFVAACQRSKYFVLNYFNAMRRFVRFIFCCGGILRRHQWVNENGVAVNTIESNKTTDPETTDLLKEQDLSADYGTSVNNIQILSNQHGNDTINANSSFFHIAKLQFSTPKSHTKKHSRTTKISTPQPSVPLSPSIQSSTQQQRKLCTNLNANLAMGEIAIVKGKSGSGKSTLLRVLSGLTPMDDGDVVSAGISMTDMTQWRQKVRYVAQFKVDIPGTPRDFILRVSMFLSYSVNTAPTAGEMISCTASYLQKWGMGSSSPETNENTSFLDNEWKTLSGGESQRTLLAIALASRPQILLLDEATSGLDAEMERRVENSVVEYVKTREAAVLWATHSDDIAERLLGL